MFSLDTVESTTLDSIEWDSPDSLESLSADSIESPSMGLEGYIPLDPVEISQSSNVSNHSYPGTCG